MPTRAGVTGATAKASVRVVNSPPTVSVVVLRTTSGVEVTRDLVGSEDDGDALRFVLSRAPSHGQARLETVGTITRLHYTSTPGWTGTETLAYQAHDASSTGIAATITITVAPGNAPRLGTITLSTGTCPTGQSVTFTQTVSDWDGAANLTNVFFSLAPSGVTPGSKSDIQAWFDVASGRFVLKSDDALHWSSPVGSGVVRENSSAKVTLLSATTSGATLTLRWQIIVKPAAAGQKLLWGRVEDVGLLTDGFRSVGRVTFLNSSSPGESGA